MLYLRCFYFCFVIEAANLSNNVFRSTFFDEKEKKVSEGVENQFDAKFTLFFGLIEKNNL